MISGKEENDPYVRTDPGTGLERVLVHKFNVEKEFSTWKAWRTNDGRVLPNSSSGFNKIENPFGAGNLILLTTYFDPLIPGRAFGGFGVRMPIDPAVVIDNQTFVEFDLYYPRSAADKYMRFEVWSTSSDGEGSQTDAGFPGMNRTQVYIRTADLDGVNNYNLDLRCGHYNGETWFKKPFCAVTPVSTGSWEYLNIDLHTETGTKVHGDLLMIGNVRITQMNHDGVPIPDVVNAKSFSEVDPIKEKYNIDTCGFLIGTAGMGVVTPDSIRGRHYEIFVDYNNLKPERHIRPPQWLREKYRKFAFRPSVEGPEWDLSTGDYLSIRDSGKPGEYKLHGYCLAWINQSPSWMRQIIPENISAMQWNPNGLFYAGGNNAAGPYQKVDKETARRVYFNHILYEMRHFMTTDARYGSSKERGIIPFHSFDVVNAEIHEGRHSILIQKNANEWNTALKNISWLMAMTDNDFGDIRQHYIYLLFKYAHIAIPNALMAANYKAGYNDPNIVPEYMRADGHDENGSIDAYICANPPLLVYNESEMFVLSKAKIAYNMIKAINAAWKSDPLYDGRNLIECIGLQGHVKAAPDLAGKSQISATLFSDLIDNGLLDRICYSELDIKQPDYAPGGSALAPAVLNQKQADVIGYQYALLFKLFDKYKKYIDHVIIWSQFGSSWQNSYVLFDHEQMASQAYYGIMDPDRFILGHSYLDNFFAGEYEKLKDDYKPKI